MSAQKLMWVFWMKRFFINHKSRSANVRRRINAFLGRNSNGKCEGLRMDSMLKRMRPQREGLSSPIRCSPASLAQPIDPCWARWIASIFQMSFAHTSLECEFQVRTIELESPGRCAFQVPNESHCKQRFECIFEAIFGLTKTRTMLINLTLIMWLSFLWCGGFRLAVQRFELPWNAHECGGMSAMTQNCEEGLERELIRFQLHEIYSATAMKWNAKSYSFGKCRKWNHFMELSMAANRALCNTVNAFQTIYVTMSYRFSASVEWVAKEISFSISIGSVAMLLPSKWSCGCPNDPYCRIIGRKMGKSFNSKL